ncbi:MAG: hypothetical protein K0S01_2672 [Herbinix sp.]|jgi:hypothetical protein|nr:hypothetical protein [Herbinix sp.]
MNTSCDVIMDLIPLVKDNVASEDSKKLVMEHSKDCESCKQVLESDSLPSQIELNDKKVITSIKKKLFFAMSVLLLIGGVIGMALNKNSDTNIMPSITIVVGIIFVGILFFKFNPIGDRKVSNFFLGRAIGTIILIVLLGIYFILKDWLHLF